ncbi:hypothetical protein Ancab_030028 [Ancistrocladus abbreviatus]
MREKEEKCNPLNPRARFAIRTPILEAIHTVIWVKIDQEVFPINVAEELCKEGDYRSSTREAIEKVPGSPSSPSTSISVVLDSVGTTLADKQQFGVVSTFAAADGRKRFQDASGCSVGAGRHSQSAAVDLVTPLGGACWTSPISPIGPVGPIGALDNMGLELAINKKGGSNGPGVRPETVISSLAVQRDEAEEVRSIPGAPYLQLDRGRRKCKKKSLSNDILQLRLSKRVIGKGTVRRRVGRIRSGMEYTTDTGGQISSGESIRDSQFINCNKSASRVWQGFRVLCGSLESISKSINVEKLFVLESGGFSLVSLVALCAVQVQFMFFDAGCVGLRVLI